MCWAACIHSWMLTHTSTHTHTYTYRMLLFKFYCQSWSINDNGYLFNVYLFTDACEQRIENTVETGMPFFPSERRCYISQFMFCYPLYSWFGTKWVVPDLLITQPGHPVTCSCQQNTFIFQKLWKLIQIFFPGGNGTKQKVSQEILTFTVQQSI